MPRLGLRSKIVLSTSVALCVLAVALGVALSYRHEATTRKLTLAHDEEIARITAARISGILQRFSRRLQDLGADLMHAPLDAPAIEPVFKRHSDLLYVFDAGVSLYDEDGNFIWGDAAFAGHFPESPAKPPIFDKVRAKQHPVVSNIFQMPLFKHDLVAIAAPLLDAQHEFRGMIAGFSQLGHSPIDRHYTPALEIRVGHEGYAYLVDGNGRAIHHRRASLVGAKVDGAHAGEPGADRAGALFTRDYIGNTVVRGFGPVPGTEWHVVVQERWDVIVKPMRRYSAVLLALLMLGLAALTFLTSWRITRTLRPVVDLTEGAKAIAAGDFGHTIEAHTGDEVQELAEQFNLMARALDASYASLREEIAERQKTEDSLRESEERFRTLFESAGDAIFLHDTHGRIVDVKPMRLQLAGLHTRRTPFHAYRGF